jgi:predicted dehydrogenase
MSLSRELVVGVLGLGHWGPNIVRCLANHPRVHLKYVCDTNVQAFARVKSLITSDCEEVVDPDVIFTDPEVNAVLIVTPASTHHALAKRALLAQKHVFCEKPLTLDVEEAEELCELAEANNKKLVVGFTFLFNHGIKKLKSLYEVGDLGSIYYLTSVRTHMGLVREDVDVVGDLVPHDISIMNYILESTPEKVVAVGSKPLGTERCDVAFISLFYPNGIIGEIHVSWINSKKERLVSIIGSEARAEFNDLDNMEPIRLFKKGIAKAEQVEPEYGNFQYLVRDGDIISPKIEISEPLGQMLDSFVCAVVDNEPVVADGRFALDVTKTLVEINRSLISIN